MTPAMKREITPIEELFEEHYSEFLRIANKITKFDRPLSEDLLHEVFVKLFQRGPVDNPRNINGFMYIVLRNSYQSILRKKRTEDDVVLFDENLVATAIFEQHFLRDQLADEHLRIVCRYACSRRVTSISGSIILLRYFYGFESRQVARLIRRSANAVDARLASARREMRLFFEQPESIRAIALAAGDAPALSAERDSRPDLVQILHEETSASPMGHCLSDEDLKFVYRISKKPPGHKLIGHVAGCEACLARVARLLGIQQTGELQPLKSVRGAMAIVATALIAPLKVAIDAIAAASTLFVGFLIFGLGSI